MRNSDRVDPGSGVTICHRVYARVGLLGNPSDGFFGKTISLSLANFCAEVGHHKDSLVSFAFKCSITLVLNMFEQRCR